MKVIIKHLLHYRREGPSIGIRIKSRLFSQGVIIPIPQWFSSLLIYIQNLYKKKDVDDFGFPCQKCSKRTFLIRGMCSKCAPTLHNTFNEQMDAYSKAAAAFKIETGKEPLAAWYEFERWCDKK